MNVGDEYTNLSGDVVTIIARGWGNIAYEVNGHRQSISEDEALDLIASRAWRPYTAPATLRSPGKCRVCGEINEYQNGPFTCWRHRNGW